VDRVRVDSYFLGKILSEYEALHDINDQQLAHYLECGHDKLARLFLCSVPRETNQQFQKDVARIADFANCNANKLITILREIESIIALRGEEAKENDSGLLMAARDRRDERKDKKADTSSKPTTDDNYREEKK
jgi:hypothetical protein